VQADGPRPKAGQPPFGQGQERLGLVEHDAGGCGPTIQDPLDQPPGTAAQIDDQAGGIRRQRQVNQNRVLNLPIIRMDRFGGSIVTDGEVGRIPAIFGHGRQLLS
jgi:hypothetical protein